MYIKQVVIDGFKSYAQRTTVSGFDPQFNAITGLNGSGKSNILDSICFLLGISNLSQVKCSLCVHSSLFHSFRGFMGYVICRITALFVQAFIFLVILVEQNFLPTWKET